MQPVASAPAPFRRVCIALNPVSGIVPDAEGAVRQAVSRYPHVEWDIRLTQGAGDATRFAREAQVNGCDLVIACGGDGTVMEVAEGVMNTNMPMSIIPFGTANVMSVELGFPADVERVIDGLVGGAAEARPVDMATIDNKPMMLRAGVGYEAEISVGASREEKRRFGRFAYMIAAWRKMRHLSPTTYAITIDDQQYAARGVTCMICNSASVGVPNLSFTGKADVSDGLLDVIVIPNLQVPSVVRVVWSILTSLRPKPKNAPEGIVHWQGKRVTVQTRHRQMIAIDGEPLKRGKRVSAQIIPHAITILIPRLAVTNTTTTPTPQVESAAS